MQIDIEDILEFTDNLKIIRPILIWDQAGLCCIQTQIGGSSSLVRSERMKVWAGIF